VPSQESKDTKEIEFETFKWVMEKLRNLKESDLKYWSHSRDVKFAPVELSDYLLINWRKEKGMK
jgi:hypothetical protein